MKFREKSLSEADAECEIVCMYYFLYSVPETMEFIIDADRCAGAKLKVYVA